MFTIIFDAKHIIILHDTANIYTYLHTMSSKSSQPIFCSTNLCLYLRVSMLLFIEYFFLSKVSICKIHRYSPYLSRLIYPSIHSNFTMCYFLRFINLTNRKIFHNVTGFTHFQFDSKSFPISYIFLYQFCVCVRCFLCVKQFHDRTKEKKK
jgi:hypothetical protein